jgi:uncharacterized repeat protein (TIGR03833 family)
MAKEKSGKIRNDVSVGLCVDIIQKADQQSGKMCRGRVKEILTNSGTHPHGIKVRLEDGRVGRVAVIAENTETRERKTCPEQKKTARQKPL